MKIIVCIKQVPDTTEVRLDPVTGTLIRDGIPSIINPDDKAALEAALTLKDQDSNTHVTVITMGPPQAEVALRECLAMGADEAVLLTDRVFGGADTWATSSTIAAGIKKIKDYDAIFAGRQAIDGDTAQVGSQIAEHLGIPQVSYVEGVEKEGDLLVLKRQFEDRYQIIEAKAPILITALTEMNKPRYMRVAGVFDAYREKEITVWGYEDVKDLVDIANLGLKGSPTKVKKSFTKAAKTPGELHEVSPDEAVQLIVDKLKSKHII